jgi:molybdate transport system substrate-binding protein
MASGGGAALTPHRALGSRIEMRGRVTAGGGTTGRPAFLVLAVALLAGVAPAAQAEEVLVFAAASLTDAVRALGDAFTQRTGIPVACSVGASGDLARQLIAGAPGDVFFSADTTRMDELERAGLVDPADRRTVLSNVLVVAVPAGATTAITSPADLATVRRLALADPDSVPAGAYARAWLEAEGVWQRVRDAVVPTLDVRAALAAVQGAHADAAVVYATDAAISPRVRVVYRVPRDQGPRIEYALAPLRTSRKPGARELVRFLASHDAAPTYERFGFVVLPPR